jgi:osmotically-inducible protein OsmY
MYKPMKFISGFVVGAGFMYLLDPNSGRRRRALIRDRMAATRHDIEDTTAAKAEFVKDKAQGVMAETRAVLKDEEVDDHTLEDRVRSELGRVTRHMGTIHVSAADGRVTLHGSVPSEEIQQVANAAQAVKGVKQVNNQLHAQEHMAEGR